MDLYSKAYFLDNSKCRGSHIQGYRLERVICSYVTVAVSVMVEFMLGCEYCVQDEKSNNIKGKIDLDTCTEVTKVHMSYS